MTHVKTRQVPTIIEHPTHVRHFTGIKLAQVQACQAGTVKEHSIQVGHVLCIKVFPQSLLAFCIHRTRMPNQ